MKKALFIILAIVLCLGCLSFAALADETVTELGDQVTLELTKVQGSGQVTIMDYDYDSDKEVPVTVTVYIIPTTGSTITAAVNIDGYSFFPGYKAYAPDGDVYTCIDGGQFMDELLAGQRNSETYSVNRDYFSSCGDDSVYKVYAGDSYICFSYDTSLITKTPADDVPSDWAKAEIAAAGNAGIITAHTNSDFRSNINRFQFAELVVNMAEKVIGTAITPADAGTFSDCKETAVLKAYAAGIVNGVGDGKFAPDTTTNREQIATMIARAIKYIEQETGTTYAPAAPNIDKFSDKDQVSAWAVDGVGLLAANGIMNGTSETTLSPQDPCTVEQSILLIYRFYQKTL